MNNSEKIILDLCGGTGSWSKPYRDAGYDVRLITLPEFDVRNFEPPENVYGILAAPPCTMFSIARCDKRAKKPRNFNEGLEIVHACLNIINKCLDWHWNNKSIKGLRFWALENPVGYLQRFIGKPIFEFTANDFGDFHLKPTQLWGFFNPPVKNNQKSLIVAGCSEHSQSIDRSTYKKGMKSKDYRAITPQGFAIAFFKANK